MAIAYPSSGVPLKLQQPLMENEHVLSVQNQLIKLGYNCGGTGANGKYNEDTYKAVKRFQESKNLLVDGIVGPNTWNSLFSGTNIITVNSRSGSDSLFNTKISDRLTSIIDSNLKGFSYNNIPSNLDENFGSYIINLASKQWVPLPVIPEQVSEAVASVWGETSIIGRSAGYRSYQGTSNRTVSFGLKFHLDLLHELSLTNNIDLTNIVDFLKSLCYPEYRPSQIRPPVCILKLADVIKIRGTCNSVNATHSLPIKDMVFGTYKNQKRYAIIDVQLNFTEVPIKAPMASEILANKQFVYKEG